MEAAATGDRATATDEASTIPAQHVTAGSAGTHHRAFCVHGDISAASDAICRDLSDDDNIDEGDNVNTNHKRVKETTKTLHRRTVTIYTAKDRQPCGRKYDLPCPRTSTLERTKTATTVEIPQSRRCEPRIQYRTYRGCLPHTNGPFQDYHKLYINSLFQGQHIL